MRENDDDQRKALSSVPRRVIRRLIRDLRYDLRETKQKVSNFIPLAFIQFVEKWLGFWFALITITYTVGVLGIGLIYTAEVGSSIHALSSTIPGVLGHIWTVGVLITLSYGVVLLSLLLVSAVRFILWCRDTYLGYWNRDTPPFTTENSKKSPGEWPPSRQQQENAWNHTRDYIGYGAILFSSVLFLAVLLNQIATETLSNLLSSRLLTILGSSIDVGIGILDFDNVIKMTAPNASQPQLVLFIVFFVLPAGVMAIGTRNLLYLVEGYVRIRIENIREGNYLSRSTVVLMIMFTYSLSICANFLSQWG